MQKVILAYIPVLHQGYLQLFSKHPEAESLYIFGEELIAHFDHLQRKDIRALPPLQVKQAIESWHIFQAVHIAGHQTLEQLKRLGPVIVMPDEDVCQELAEKYLSDCQIEFDSIFLRRDKKKSLAEIEVPCDQVITANEFVRKVMGLAIEQAKKSPDWWRQIGGVAVRDGEILITTYNRHVPSPHSVFAFGDPRSNFKKGLHFELSPALHTEAAIISEAARRSDIHLTGADLYITTFPCPPCARLVAHSGIRRLFFQEGYSVYDGVDVLRALEVKLIKVQM